MAQSVRNLPKEILAVIDVHEWDMRSDASRSRLKNAKVKRLPSIAVGGRMVFEALIPERDELIAEIERFLEMG